MNKFSLRKVILLIAASLMLAFSAYAVSFWLLRLRPLSDFLAVEGILFILAGACFLLGSGGISSNTSKAAVLASAAGAMGKKTIGPSEIFRKDAWKPKGHVLLGLGMILAGAILIVFSLVWP